MIVTLLFSDQETPPSMLRLQTLSNKGHGWLLVLHSMVNVIPINEPLGPAVITLVMDDCALPAKVILFVQWCYLDSQDGLPFLVRFRTQLLKFLKCSGFLPKQVREEGQIPIAIVTFALPWDALQKN